MRGDEARPWTHGVHDDVRALSCLLPAFTQNIHHISGPGFKLAAALPCVGKMVGDEAEQFLLGVSVTVAAGAVGIRDALLRFVVSKQLDQRVDRKSVV